MESIDACERQLGLSHYLPPGYVHSTLSYNKPGQNKSRLCIADIPGNNHATSLRISSQGREHATSTSRGYCRTGAVPSHRKPIWWEVLAWEKNNLTLLIILSSRLPERPDPGIPPISSTTTAIAINLDSVRSPSATDSTNHWIVTPPPPRSP